MPSRLLSEHEAVVFVEETTTDSRGNAVTRPSATSVTIRCRVWPRAAAADKAGADLPRWSLIAPPDTPLGKWSRVEALGREFSVSSWPRAVGPEGSAAQHVAAELTEQR